MSDKKMVRWLALFLVLAVCPAVVLAHAKLIRSQPAAQAMLSEPPKTIELWFNEDLEPTFNTIVVTDESGRRLIRTTRVSATTTGKYRLIWKS